MNVLISEGFTNLFLSGLWLPYYSKRKKFARVSYNIYTCILSICLGIFIISLTFAIFKFESRPEYIAEAWYFGLMAVNGGIKGFNYLWKRTYIDDLVEEFTERRCKPRSDIEMSYCASFNRISRYINTFSLGMSWSSVVLMSSAPFIFYRGKNFFPLRIFDTDYVYKNINYWSFFFLQTISMIPMNIWNVTNDILISGLIVQICIQLELVSHRLRMLPATVKLMIRDRRISKEQIRRYEHRVIKQNVQHHVTIFKLAKKIETNFAACIATQYYMSTLLLCISICEIEMIRTNSTQIILIIFYILFMVFELFIYCWFGNELITKSLRFSELICKGDWTVLHNKTLKEILIIMIVTSSPISIKCGPFITLSNEAYLGILRSSHSAFKYIKGFR